MSDNSWKILIVDDEPEVHTVTKLVMSNEIILGRRLEFLDAGNGEEAKKVLQEHDDIALVLLDVVMSTENDGLLLAKWIREDLDNHMVRIVLRTGNPGEAPEIEVITGYDINDYKEKSELTAKKLRTLFYTSLRSYRDLLTLDQLRRGLMRIASSLADMYIHPNLEEFTSGLLHQITSYLFLNQGAMYGISSAFSALKDSGDPTFKVVAATGVFADSTGRDLDSALPDELHDVAQSCVNGTGIIEENGVYFHCFQIPENGKALLVMVGVETLADEDRDLLRIFVENAGQAFHNLVKRENGDADR